MSARLQQDRLLPPVASDMLAGIYQHRLLSTRQLHALYTPHTRPAWTRLVLALLADRGLIDRVQGPGKLSLWFLTEYGADTVQATGTPAEPRRRLVGRAQAEGPLRQHTLRVNDVGIAFVHAARQHGDECTPQSWRHEIAHPISPSRARRPTELVIADALLTYLQSTRDGGLVLHQRFIELDRGTRPAEQLAQKITRYTRLRYYTPPAPDPAFNDQPPQPLWRSHYRSWPHLLIVFADQPPQRISLRIKRTLLLHQSDPARGQHPSIPVSFVALEDLARDGPFAAIFTTPEPSQPTDWLGQTPTPEGDVNLWPPPAQPQTPLAENDAGKSSTPTA